MNQSTRTSIAAALVSASIAVCVASGCGEAFSSSGGAGGAGSTGGAPPSGAGTMASSSGTNSTATSSSAVSSATSSGTGNVSECTWAQGDCPPGKYCKDTQCTDGTGVCIQRAPSQPLDFAPVCGCNGLTFWNAGVASSYGMSTHHVGVCTEAEAVPCTGKADCATFGAGCALQTQACNEAPAGICFVTHSNCSATTQKATSCDETCENVCSMIKNSEPFHTGNGC